jgi:Ca2+ regulator and membrane fusion protein Fig1
VSLSVTFHDFACASSQAYIFFRFGSIGLACIIFCLLSTFPGWHTEEDEYTGSEIDIKPFPNRPILVTCLGLSTIATLFSLVSALWQHTSAASAATIIEVSTLGAVKVQIGAVSTVLVWLAFVLFTIVAMVLFFIRHLMMNMAHLTGGYSN